MNQLRLVVIGESRPARSTDKANLVELFLLPTDEGRGRSRMTIDRKTGEGLELAMVRNAPLPRSVRV